MKTYVETSQRSEALYVQKVLMGKENGFPYGVEQNQDTNGVSDTISTV